MTLTITEALAEIKTVNKRLATKREAMKGYVARQDGVKDPLEKSGGSEEFLRRERQACADLGQRVVDLRRGIHDANSITVITIAGKSRTIQDWLTWRREIAGGEQAFLSGLRITVNTIRQQAQRANAQLIPPGGQAQNPIDYMVNLDERALGTEIEQMEEILSTLDGQLSLKNATTVLPEYTETVPPGVFTDVDEPL